MVANYQHRTLDFVAGICLVLVVFISAYTLELTYWTYNLNRITSLALLGIAIGFLIGLSNYSRNLSFILSIFYGIALIILQLIIPLDSDPDWKIRILVYFNRIGITFSQLIRNVPLEDGIIFLTSAGFIYLITNISLGFRFARSKPIWLPFLINIALFFCIQFYLPQSRRNSFVFLLYLLFVVLFIGRQHYLQKHTLWKNNRVREDKEVSSFITRTLMILALLMIAVAGGVPAISSLAFKHTSDERGYWWQRNSSSWEILRNFFYPLRQQTGFGEGYFPEILALGTARSLKNDDVLKIEVNDDYSIPGRFYWKGRVYSTYENGLWKNENLVISSTYDFFYEIPSNSGIDTEIFSINYLYPREVIFTPQYVNNVGRKATYLLSIDEDDIEELVGIVDYGLVRTGEEIEITGGFNTVTFTQLKNEHGDYPEGIRNKYLQLPGNFPDLIKHLSLDISINESTKIEKALKIIDYLRNSYRYKDFIDIPEGNDPVEWFLFDGREGFCNYFTSSAVLMLRSIGIPARMVVGYAQGEKLNNTNQFIVKIKNSHTWVEAYFNESGWVTLEPTPSEPAIIFTETEKLENESISFEREEALFLQPPDFNNDERETINFQEILRRYSKETSTPEKSKSRLPILKWIIITITVLFSLLCFIYFALFRQKSFRLPLLVEKSLMKNKIKLKWVNKWAEYEELSFEERNYYRIKFLSKLIMRNPDVNLTPHEFFDRLFSKINVPDSLIISKNYQKVLYGFEKFESTKEAGEYRRIVFLITKQWLKRNIEFFKFQMNLGRFNREY